MEIWAKRIHDRMIEVGKKPADLARACGIKPGSVSGWTKADVEKAVHELARWTVGTMVAGVGLFIVIMTFVLNNATPKGTPAPAPAPIIIQIPSPAVAPATPAKP